MNGQLRKSTPFRGEIKTGGFLQNVVFCEPLVVEVLNCLCRMMLGAGACMRSRRPIILVPRMMATTTRLCDFILCRYFRYSISALRRAMAFKLLASESNFLRVNDL
jgi:hypothetical protein